MFSEIKKNLSYAYNILAKLQLDDHTYTHLSARQDGADFYYIYPFGLRFSEVTENNLLKVDLNGNVLEGREEQYNKTGYIIHGSIYSARKDINAIFHLHTPASVAVSATKGGLLPISQWALHFYNKIAYHKYNSLALTNEHHGNQLINDLSDKKVMLLENHGLITAGKTIHEAMFYTHHLELACKTQCMALSSGMEIITPTKEVCEKSVNDLLSFEEDIGKRDWDAWVRYIKTNN